MSASYRPHTRFVRQLLLLAAALNFIFPAPPHRSVCAAGAGVSGCAAASDGSKRRENPWDA